MSKFRDKYFKFSDDFHPNKVLGFGLENTNNWEEIYYSLRKINLYSKESSLGIIFCSKQMVKYYKELKKFFIQQYIVSDSF